jgi:hypothetical protein
MKDATLLNEIMDELDEKIVEAATENRAAENSLKMMFTFDLLSRETGH